MSEVGAALKQEREAQEKTRADVARATGILIHHLAALEHGNFDDLPDDDTVAGYVKTYAEYLGFVPEEPVAEFRAERRAAKEAAPAAGERRTTVRSDRPPTVREPEPAVPGSRTRKARWPWWVAAAAVVLVLLWVGTRDGSDDRQEDVPPQEPGTDASVETLPVEDAAPAIEPVPEDPEPSPAAEAEPRTSEPEPPPPRPARTAPVSGLAIDEYGVGAGVEGHRLVGRSDRFELGSRVWFWTRVRGGRPGDTIEHVWIHEGREVATTELRVGSADWRTRSYKTMFDGSAGQWTVEARDASGTVLARSAFTCVP